MSPVRGEGHDFPFLESFEDGTLGKWALSKHDKYKDQPVSIKPLNITNYRVSNPTSSGGSNSSSTPQFLVYPWAVVPG